MIDPRWRKVLRDTTTNPARTLLVVASIAVGIFAVGTVQQLRTVILGEMQAVYDRSNVAHATLFASNLDDDLVESVRRIPEVADAAGRNFLSVSVLAAPDRWETLFITALDDFEQNQINLLAFDDKRLPAPAQVAGQPIWPQEGQILIERGSLDSATVLPAGLQWGDELEIETESGRERRLSVVGAVYDANAFPTAFTGNGNGYVDFDTFERLGGSRTYTRLFIRVNGEPTELADKEYITAIANRVADKLEKGGLSVSRIDVPEPGKLVFQDIFDSLALLLTPLGLLALFLSGFLVVNTVSALMAQQVRQIGVMKAIGGRRSQIMAIYLAAILSFSLLALLVAIPITVAVSSGLLAILGGFINIEFPAWSLPLNVLVIQLFVGLVVPLLAALYPIYRGTGVTVREAISDYGVGSSGADFLGVLLGKIRILSRPLQISLRNTFRRRARLVLTLIMLVLGGMIFMTVGSVRTSLSNLIEEALAYNQFDIQIEFERSYRAAQIEQLVTAIPGVVRAESWSQGLATRLRPDGSESGPITLTALPATSPMVQPTLAAGRWLLAEDENAIVVSQKVLTDEPDIEIGSRIRLEIDGRESAWVVVGVAQVLGGPPDLVPGYVNYPYFSRLTGDVRQASSVQVQIDEQAGLDSAAMATLMEESLTASGLRVASTFTADRIRQISGGFFDIIIYLLSGMGVLIATVGALGLMGTMSTNVLERTREVRVMRAIGASDGAVQTIVVVEGVLIGLISWLVGAALAFPVGAAISSAVGQVLFNVDLPYSFDGGGVTLWLVIVAILAGFASFLPAWSASRLTVREILAYE